MDFVTRLIIDLILHYIEFDQIKPFFASFFLIGNSFRQDVANSIRNVENRVNMFQNPSRCPKFRKSVANFVLMWLISYTCR